eukprot:s1236_g11.t1
MGDWLLRHIPGSELPADLGTKVLSFEKFRGHKILMGMFLGNEKEKIENGEKKKGGKERAEKAVENKSATVQALKAIILFAKLAQAKGERDDQVQLRNESSSPQGLRRHHQRLLANLRALLLPSDLLRLLANLRALLLPSDLLRLLANLRALMLLGDLQMRLLIQVLLPRGLRALLRRQLLPALRGEVEIRGLEAATAAIIEATAKELQHSELARLVGFSGLPIGDDEQIDAKAASARARGDLFFEDTAPDALESLLVGGSSAAHEAMAQVQKRKLGNLEGVENICVDDASQNPKAGSEGPAESQAGCRGQEPFASSDQLPYVRRSAENQPMLSPRSARGRGGQAQQGGWSQRNLGAGRSRANKAEWKDKLKIEVTKVREMPESDPKSPKGKAPAQVWGTTIPPQPLRRGDTLTPSSMQARIEQKLTMVLGQASRRPERTRTLPASAFPSAFQSQLAELTKKKPASAEDLDKPGPTEELLRELLGNTFDCHAEQRVVRNARHVSTFHAATDALTILAQCATRKKWLQFRQGWPGATGVFWEFSPSLTQRYPLWLRDPKGLAAIHEHFQYQYPYMSMKVQKPKNHCRYSARTIKPYAALAPTGSLASWG